MLGAGVFDELVGLENVVADLLAPLGGSAGAEFVDAGGVLFLLHLGEFATEDFQGFGLVLLLGTFVLDGDDGAGGGGGEAGGGGCGAAGSPAAGGAGGGARACLKSGDVPSGEGFWAAGKQFFRGNPDGFQGKIAPSRGQKTR